MLHLQFFKGRKQHCIEKRVFSIGIKPTQIYNLQNKGGELTMGSVVELYRKKWCASELHVLVHFEHKEEELT